MDVTQRRISIIARGVGRFTTRTMRREGIGASEFDLIQAVRCHPGITQAEVCQRLEIDKGAAARQFARLEAKGYLRRETNPADRRSRRFMPPIRQRNSRIPRRIWRSCSMNGCWSP